MAIKKIAMITPVREGHISGPVNSVSRLAKIITDYLGIEVKVFTIVGNSFLYNNVRFERIYRDHDFSEFDLCVFSGIWFREYVSLSKSLLRKNIPYVVTPRSSLMKSQFRKSIHKKLLFLLFGGYKFINSAYRIHFLTNEEKENSAFSGNGFVAPNALSNNLISASKSYLSSLVSKRFIFLGRFQNYHKGIDLMLNAIKSVSHTMRKKGWSLTLCGPDNIGDLAKAKQFVAINNLNDLVDFKDAKQGSDKERFLGEGDVFLCTSRYEGQPQALLEAMLFKCTCIVTAGSNMSRYVLDNNIGIACKTDSGSISEALLAIMNTDSLLLSNLKQSAHEAMVRDFSEKEVANKIYENLIAKF